MGRTARNYPKGRLKLRTPKEVQPGKRYPIYIEYNWQADSLRKTTEVSVFPKDWNENGYGLKRLAIFILGTKKRSNF